MGCRQDKWSQRGGRGVGVGGAGVGVGAGGRVVGVGVSPCRACKG